MGNQRGGGTMSKSEAERINRTVSSTSVTTGTMSEAEAKALSKNLLRGVVKAPAKPEK